MWIGGRSATRLAAASRSAREHCRTVRPGFALRPAIQVAMYSCGGIRVNNGRPAENGGESLGGGHGRTRSASDGLEPVDRVRTSLMRESCDYVLRVCRHCRSTAVVDAAIADSAQISNSHNSDLAMAAVDQLRITLRDRTLGEMGRSARTVVTRLRAPARLRLGCANVPQCSPSVRRASTPELGPLLWRLYRCPVCVQIPSADCAWRSGVSGALRRPPRRRRRGPLRRLRRFDSAVTPPPPRPETAP